MKAEALKWCREAPDETTDLAQVVCYDYTDSAPIREAPGTTANDRIVLAPNQQIVVRVLRRRKDPAVTIALGGTPGETKLRLDGELSEAGSGSKATASVRTFNDDCHRDYTLYEARFVPRTPGFVALSLTTSPSPTSASKAQDEAGSASRETIEGVDAVGNHQALPQVNQPGEYTYGVAVQAGSNGAVEKTERTAQAKWTVAGPAPVSKTIEFLVPNVYSGALRVGLSAVLGLDEHVYTKRQAPGVNVMEVLDHGASAAEAELVVGYAPYWQAFTRAQGRDYIRHYKGTAVAQRLAPYLGLAVLSAAPGVDSTRVRWLRSFYLGAEWEFFQNTSIAFALTLSRVDVLAPNVTVGGPIGKDTALTDSEIHPGFGIVINFSPDFFKFAAGFK